MAGFDVAECPNDTAARRAIYRLPDELLVEIFRHVQASISSWSQARKSRPWYILLRVCKHWSDVVRSSPALWRVIDLRGRPDLLLLKYSLTYSGDMPVDLAFTFMNESFTALTPLIAPHTRRIRTLKLDELNTITDHALATLLYHTMPMLEELFLSFHSEGHDGEDEELEPLVPDQNEDEDGDPIRYPFFWFPKADQFPRIVHLHLGRSVAFSLRFPILPSLKRLELRVCIVVGDVSIADFVKYLAQHPVLEELSISRLNVSLADGASLRLPRTLRKFELEDYPLRISGFLSKLAALPADLYVGLHRRLRYVGTDPEILSTTVHSLPGDRSVLPILTLVETITVRQIWWEEYCIIGRTPTGTTIELAADVPEHLPEPLDFLGDLRDAFGHAPVTEIRVEGHEDHKLTEEQWKRTLLAFPRLRKIAVTNTSAEEDSDASIALVKALRATKTMVDGVPLCSQLEELELAAVDAARDAELAKEIAECLTFRRSAGTPLKSLLVHLKTTWRTKKASAGSFEKREELYSSVVGPLTDVLSFEHAPHRRAMVVEEESGEDSESASGSGSTDHSSGSVSESESELEGTNSDMEASDMEASD
ncbi:hypothetical protein C8T65DRAFT_649837 [Cerioporus squamosus]|nr:hypothetical protein C8T65DRAFT_649837 [Cerioporus squamosus]